MTTTTTRTTTDLRPADIPDAAPDADATSIHDELRIVDDPAHRRPLLWIAGAAAAALVATAGALVVVRATSADPAPSSSTSSAANDRAESAHGTSGGVRTGAGPVVLPSAATASGSDLAEVMHGSASRLISGTGIVSARIAAAAADAVPAATARDDAVAHGTAGGLAFG